MSNRGAKPKRKQFLHFSPVSDGRDRSPPPRLLWKIFVYSKILWLTLSSLNLPGKVVEGTMHVVSSMPLLNKRRMFRLKGTTLECISLESDLIIARFDMSECDVKTEKDTLVLQMPNAVPVILQPPPEDYERWKNVLRQVISLFQNLKHCISSTVSKRCWRCRTGSG